MKAGIHGMARAREGDVKNTVVHLEGNFLTFLSPGCDWGAGFKLSRSSGAPVEGKLEMCQVLGTRGGPVTEKSGGVMRKKASLLRREWKKKKLDGMRGVGKGSQSRRRR